MSSPFQIRLAALAIKQGSLIAYPTESVYGIGCDPFNQNAVFDLLALKDRPIEKGLIVVAHKLEFFDALVEPLTTKQKSLIQNNRSTTWIVPAKHAPYWLRGRHTSLAIRLSAHPMIEKLCKATQHAIVSTSANPSGTKPAKNALQTQHYFADSLDMILHAATGVLKRPTEIKDLLSQTIVRAN